VRAPWCAQGGPRRYIWQYPACSYCYGAPALHTTLRVGAMREQSSLLHTIVKASYETCDEQCLARCFMVENLSHGRSTLCLLWLRNDDMQAGVEPSKQRVYPLVVTRISDRW